MTALGRLYADLGSCFNSANKRDRKIGRKRYHFFAGFQKILCLCDRVISKTGEFDITANVSKKQWYQNRRFLIPLVLSENFSKNFRIRLDFPVKLRYNKVYILYVEVKATMFKATQAKPFVKWAGGKSQILEEIRRRYPVGLGKNIIKYTEPFVGGGAVLFDVLTNYSLEDVFICDVNRELIITYITIRDEVDELVEILHDFEDEYLPADTNTRKTIYYRNRERFNTLKLNLDESTELAALFIFLNKTCFNGLYRVNSKGGFNVPQGGYKNPTICDSENLCTVSYAVRNVQMVYGDYWLSRNFIDENTFAYFDPPYRPLTATASFTAYSGDGFGDEQQVELARYIDEMSERGAWCVASNSDPTNIDDNDDFMDRLYAKHKIMRINANRAINSVGSRRGQIRELLIARG